MRNSDIALYSSLQQKLQSYTNYDLSGIQDPNVSDCLIRQLIDSIRRTKYIKVIAAKQLSATVANPSSNAFDPLKAAVWHIRHNNIDEAFWLVFLATHFGKNKRTGWKLVKAVYGALNQQQAWTWQTTSTDPNGFLRWLDANNASLRQVGSFGNHRKYESLSAYTSRGTGAAVTSYIEWVTNKIDHQGLISSAQAIVGNNPRTLFSYLYNNMSSVATFGRTGKFDYLTMIGKIGLVNIEPASVYMTGATGPLSGARLLFEGNKNAKLKAAKLNLALEDLESHLGLSFGMQVLEDSLCNWQKDPNNYHHFSG